MTASTQQSHQTWHYISASARKYLLAGADPVGAIALAVSDDQAAARRAMSLDGLTPAEVEAAISQYQETARMARPRLRAV